MSIGNSPEDERPFEDDREEARFSVGHALRQARIAAGLTVDDVTNATRVRIAIVHAIEADDFAPVAATSTPGATSGPWPRLSTSIRPR